MLLPRATFTGTSMSPCHSTVQRSPAFFSDRQPGRSRVEVDFKTAKKFLCCPKLAMKQDEDDSYPTFRLGRLHAANLAGFSAIFVQALEISALSGCTPS
jgi:hypothetical protein